MLSPPPLSSNPPAILTCLTISVSHSPTFAFCERSSLSLAASLLVLLQIKCNRVSSLPGIISDIYYILKDRFEKALMRWRKVRSLSELSGKTSYSELLRWWEGWKGGAGWDLRGGKAAELSEGERRNSGEPQVWLWWPSRLVSRRGWELRREEQVG